MAGEGGGGAGERGQQQRRVRRLAAMSCLQAARDDQQVSGGGRRQHGRRGGDSELTASLRPNLLRSPLSRSRQRCCVTAPAEGQRPGAPEAAAAGCSAAHTPPRGPQRARHSGAVSVSLRVSDDSDSRHRLPATFHQMALTDIARMKLFALFSCRSLWTVLIVLHGWVDHAPPAQVTAVSSRHEQPRETVDSDFRRLSPRWSEIVQTPSFRLHIPILHQRLTAVTAPTSLSLRTT